VADRLAALAEFRLELGFGADVAEVALVDREGFRQRDRDRFEVGVSWPCLFTRTSLPSSAQRAWGDGDQLPGAGFAGQRHRVDAAWAPVEFEISFFRRYRFRGESRSYVSASCPIPAAFTAGFLAFAQARYGFADGRELGTEAVRSCRAR